VRNFGSALILVVALTGCGSIVPGSEKVVFTKEPADVVNCKLIPGHFFPYRVVYGIHNDDSIRDAVYSLGGDTVLLVKPVLYAATGIPYNCRGADPRHPFPVSADQPQQVATAASMGQEPPRRTPPLKGGFRDLNWGNPPAPGMTRLDGKGLEGELYERPTDALSVGGVPLSSIRYKFIDGQLRSVTLHVAPAKEAALREALIKAWGTPSRSDEKATSWGEPQDVTGASFFGGGSSIKRPELEYPMLVIVDQNFLDTRVKTQAREGL
jgi:hypothetical protein